MTKAQIIDVLSPYCEYTYAYTPADIILVRCHVTDFERCRNYKIPSWYSNDRLFVITNTYLNDRSGLLSCGPAPRNVSSPFDFIPLASEIIEIIPPHIVKSDYPEYLL